MGRRKPTALKLLSGAFDKDPQRRNHLEPFVELESPDCPKHVVGEARREWKRITSELLMLKVVSAVERGALEQYCTTYAAWRDAMDTVKKEGSFTKTMTGTIQEHPASRKMRNLSSDLLRFLTEFGMTPASRSKLHVIQDTKSTTEVEQRYFG